MSLATQVCFCAAVYSLCNVKWQDQSQQLVLVMQAAALAFYIICGFLSLGFVTNFVVIIVFLMLDFWIVRFCYWSMVLKALYKDKHRFI